MSRGGSPPHPATPHSPGLSLHRTLFAAGGGRVSAPTEVAAAGVISPQLPSSPNSGPAVTQSQVHSAQASAEAYGRGMPSQSQPPGPLELPYFFCGVLPGPMCPFPYFLLRGAGLGWGLTVLAGFADASRGRNWDLGRKTLSCIITSSLPRTLPSPFGYLGQLPPH